MSPDGELRAVVERALERTLAEGADAADALLVESDAVEARVRGEEIDFVKQARERTLGIRALLRGDAGLRSALTSTSDLSPAAVERMAGETVALARATAADPAAGLPDEEFARDLPELGLFDPADRDVPVQERIADARRAEAAARELDPRIVNSEGSQVGSSFSRVVYGDSRGFLAEYAAARHSLFSEPVARANGSMQRDYWMTSRIRARWAGARRTAPCGAWARGACPPARCRSSSTPSPHRACSGTWRAA
jgi:PmbA protein